MPEAKGYSIWLMPSGKAYDVLCKIILRLSRKYNTPYFEPHVTLIGEISGSENEVVSKTANLASFLQPFKIEFRRVGYTNEYFRCLFLMAAVTDVIMKANHAARKAFGVETSKEYMPHLSLIYGNLLPAAKKEIIADIGEEMHASFVADRIALFSTADRPEDWFMVKEFSLKRTNSEF